MKNMRLRTGTCGITVLLAAVAVWYGGSGRLQAGEACTSGPAVGQRPGPYSFLMATGDNRGKQHCYICETGDKPAVIIFARSPSDSLGQLATEIDRVMGKGEHAELRSWITFTSDNQPELDARLVEWSRKHGLRKLPVGVFEDAKGPPTYKLNDEADVTILLSIKQKVVANFALRQGELTEKRIKEVLEALPKLAEPKPAPR